MDWIYLILYVLIASTLLVFLLRKLKSKSRQQNCKKCGYTAYSDCKTCGQWYCSKHLKQHNCDKAI